jgi:curved DNA-binding protein CbpA
LFSLHQPMKDYYSILRVNRSASTADIRRAYRVLVQQLHPDINPDPAAHELIKEVNEAYDVLGDEAKKREYDYLLANPYGTIEVPQPPVHRDPYFRRKGRPAPPRNTEKSERLRLIEKSLSFFRWVFKIATLFCFVLLIDFLAPRSNYGES